MLYTQPHYQPAADTDVFDLVDRTVLGTLITAHPEGVAISHPVFRIDRSRGPHGTLVSHVAAANDHVRFLEQGLPSIAILMDSGQYISPSWYPGYPQRDSAPTWGFMVAHFHGRPALLSRDDTVRHLADLVAHMERGREQPWQMKELGPGGVDRRVPRIVAFEIPVASCEIKFKLGQDERPADMRGAADQLRRDDHPALAQAIERHCKL